MREYKFRGKAVMEEDESVELTDRIVKHGDWVYGNLFELVNYLGGDTKYAIQVFTQVPCSFDRMIPCFDSESIEVIPETVGQFTGLHDKNGKEIYEGDVVIFEGSKHEIIYCDYYAMFMAQVSEHYRISLFECEGSMIEIIGNIHDKEK